MGNILAQIKSKRPQTDDSALHDMVGDIRRRAESDAMASAKEQVTASVQKELHGLRNQLDSTRTELATANANTLVAQGERDTFRKLQGASEKALDPLQKKIGQLKAQIKLEQNTLRERSVVLKSEIKTLAGEVSAAKAEAQALQVENAKLVTKLESPAPVKTKLVRKKAREMPEFILSNVERGIDNRITGAKIKPVRAK